MLEELSRAPRQEPRRLKLEDAAPSDGEVVRRILAGDVEQYALLVHRYRDRYARYAVSMLGSRDDADDAVQDAFVRAYTSLAQCREPEKFANWFFLILRNRCFAERRRPWNRATRSLEPGDDRIAAPDRFEGSSEREDRQRALGRALQTLTPVQREVFVLKHVEELSYEDISDRLGTSVASLKMRMHRAYDQLRAELKELA
jgi:RNA polymerase sigma-70 factor, ECF subfamily